MMTIRLLAHLSVTGLQKQIPVTSDISQQQAQKTLALAVDKKHGLLFYLGAV